MEDIFEYLKLCSDKGIVQFSVTMGKAGEDMACITIFQNQEKDANHNPVESMGSHTFIIKPGESKNLTGDPYPILGL